MKVREYCKLMRLDKPAGSILLWAPTAWALWTANLGFPNLLILIYFLIGTILMRSAGCVINDIVDRKIDKFVSRTKLRVLTNGDIRLSEALLIFIGLLILALIIVLQLPTVCFYESLVALFLTIIYPFFKRFFKAPQLILGLAFSMGIPMAYSASSAPVDMITLLLFTLNFLWIVAYDTMYAMVDRDDDRLIGVKSTALLFASFDRYIIGALQLLFHSCWLLIAIQLNLHIFFYLFWALGLIVIVYQQILISRKNRDDYFNAFLTNSWYGVIMWIGLAMDLYFC